MKNLKSSDIRQMYLDFWATKGVKSGNRALSLSTGQRPYLIMDQLRVWRH